VLRRQRPDSIQHETSLHRQRLLNPQGAVIAEYGDPIDRPHKIRVANGCHAGHEIEDRPLGRAFAPCR